MNQPYFETERLIIRDFEPADLMTIHQYASDKEVVQHQRWGPNDLDATRSFLEKAINSSTVHPRLTYELAIVLKLKHEHIGGCGIFLKDDLQTASIGYILNPDYWNRGIVTEAVKGLIEFAIQQLKIKSLQATCDTRNIASRRVLEKTGFHLSKTIKNHFVQKGVKRDSYVFKY